MKWFTKLFEFLKSKPIVNKRSKKNGESITGEEGSFIAYCFKHKLPPCPDCQEGFFLQGPQGCGSVNLLCNKCLSEFNIFWLTEDQVIGERISDSGSCKKERCSQIYGIKTRN